jgi:long-subunit acyl-CoA synthetase (AMP-forming)
MIPLVPPVALLLSKHPSADKFDLSSVRGIVSSAAPLSLDIINTIISKYKWEVLQGYGMTECTLASHFTPSGQRKYGSVGQIMPFFEGKVSLINF